eukprot:SAG22_NODE_737_length_7529_cov_32.840108_3_plen_759_part_00
MLCVQPALETEVIGVPMDYMYARQTQQVDRGAASGSFGGEDEDYCAWMPPGTAAGLAGPRALSEDGSECSAGEDYYSGYSSSSGSGSGEEDTSTFEDTLDSISSDDVEHMVETLDQEKLDTLVGLGLDDDRDGKKSGDSMETPPGNGGMRSRGRRASSRPTPAPGTKEHRRMMNNRESARLSYERRRHRTMQLEQENARLRAELDRVETAQLARRRQNSGRCEGGDTMLLGGAGAAVATAVAVVAPADNDTASPANNDIWTAATTDCWMPGSDAGDFLPSSGSSDEGTEGEYGIDMELTASTSSASTFLPSGSSWDRAQPMTPEPTEPPPPPPPLLPPPPSTAPQPAMLVGTSAPLPTTKQVKKQKQKQKQICEHCGFDAPSACHLIRHMRTHTGDRPYACPHPGCGYRGTQRSHLKTHMQRHAGSGIAIMNELVGAAAAAGGGTSQKRKGGPHACTICTYSAKRKQHLLRHIRLVHEKKKHQQQAARAATAAILAGAKPTIAKTIAKKAPAAATAAAASLRPNAQIVAAVSAMAVVIGIALDSNSIDNNGLAASAPAMRRLDGVPHAESRSKLGFSYSDHAAADSTQYVWTHFLPRLVLLVLSIVWIVLQGRRPGASPGELLQAVALYSMLMILTVIPATEALVSAGAMPMDNGTVELGDMFSEFLDGDMMPHILPFPRVLGIGFVGYGLGTVATLSLFCTDCDWMVPRHFREMVARNGWKAHLGDWVTVTVCALCFNALLALGPTLSACLRATALF